MHLQKKKNRQWKNKIIVLFQDPQINEWAERQGRKAKGRALQSEHFLITFFLVLHVCSPIARQTPTRGGSRSKIRHIYQEQDERI